MPGIMRFYSVASEKNDLPGYFAASKKLMWMGTIGTLVLGLLLVGGVYLFEQGDWVAMLVMAIIFSQLANYNSTLSAIQNAARQRVVVAFHGGIESWVKIALAVLLILLFGPSEITVVASYILATVVILGSQLFFFGRLNKGKLSVVEDKTRNQWIQRMWIYSKPFAIFNLFTWAQASSDRWALETFSSSTEVGFFAALMQVGYTPIAMAVGLLVSFVGPILHQRSGDALDHNRNKEVHRASWILTFICLAATAVAFFVMLGLHEWIFSLLVAPNYRSVSYLLPWIVLAGGFFAAGQVLVLKIMSDMNSSALLWPKLTTAVIGVGFNYLGAYFGGLQGVVVAALLFSLLHFFWIVFAAGVNIRRPPNLRNGFMS